MDLKRKFSGGALAVIGFLLSPLSWWNDAFVNLPLAFAFAEVVSFFYKPAFNVSVVVGYWLTNVLGFILMHKGGEAALRREEKPYSRRDLLKDVLISLAYTALIIVLIKLKLLQPFENYFKRS